MREHVSRLTCLAVSTRICVIGLQFLANVAIADHLSDGFVSPAASIPRSAIDQYIWWLLGGFLRWDAQYFLHVAIYGYVFENTLAFFPGYPLCVRLLGALLQPLCCGLNIVSVYLIASVLANLLFFVLATRSLYHLSHKVLNDKRLAYLAATLFTVNPAGVFFTAPYSEALFSYLSFRAMLSDNIWLCSTYVALSAAVRSNGIVNLGFPLYRLAKQWMQGSKSSGATAIFACKLLCVSATSVCLFAAYQMYCYSTFCATYAQDFDEGLVQLAAEKSLILRGRNVTGLCAGLPYFYVQNRYWKVGFLRYFQLKQLPNFALAAPVLYLSLSGGLRYFARNARLIPTLATRSGKGVDVNLFPYAVHLLFLVVSCLCFVHIQVSTRLLCSSTPTVYWFAARLLRRKGRRLRLFGFSLELRLVLVYFLAYTVVGTILFSNFYPWT